ncbi:MULTISPECIES: GGDEF domain-containing protein [unclassified Rhizobacter]|uniref:GGDEF domain-containing protein n=1 Tax=unclassified Rhizobacter TaxID=2640088 RepID=UPI0006FD9411|nr:MULTISPECIES: GGDEF domain-containing protein [unclassified Rhizobacter]KQU67207.1 diguanylate cyclase [Rhizobacter sp. Root29]KQV98082.1 diguanylate cyclase [Rhizobacter sp. Root1238]KRB01980.1 diguanylate cyclase [Rhizobacter sp. Root16D2]
MSELVDHLAELTGFRDRDILDVTLVGALRDLLRPLSVAIYRSVGDQGQERWLTRAHLGQHDAVARADPVWADVDSLPEIDAFPARLQAMNGQTVQAVPGTPNLTIFAVSTDREVVGVLEVETEAPMSDESQRLVCSILRIYRNFEGLLDYSERDTLTGLLNRKTFDESFLKATNTPALVSHADTRRAPPSSHQHYWLGVIDIDHFKSVNDNYGHLIGDEVLLLLSRLMRSSFRFHDRLYRFGGEEFVVLMRCAREEDTAMALERMRQNTEAYAFPQVGRITISIGFTEVKPGDTPSGAFERADKAVYYAKGHGRNQVRSHAALVASGALEDDSIIGDVELF